MQRRLCCRAPNQSYMPQPVAPSQQAMTLSPVHIEMPNNPTEMGSNGWAIGSEMSATGNGMVLANPHFPHTGNQRFWQFGTEIPGELKVVGGSLSGMPGIVNIGFNEHVAWTHTFSTANRFVVHQLALDPEDETGTHYLVDGESVPMTTKTHQIQVNTGNGLITLKKPVITVSLAQLLKFLIHR